MLGQYHILQVSSFRSCPHKNVKSHSSHIGECDGFSEKEEEEEEES
jgi:hypothetical protein